MGSGETEAARLTPLHAAGRSKASVPSVALPVEPWVALKPRPRLAKAVQIRHWLAPPLSAWAAAMIASRASTKPGLHGWSFIASMTSCSETLLPAAVLAQVAEKACAPLGAH